MVRTPVPRSAPPKPKGIRWFQPARLPVALSPELRQRLTDHFLATERRHVGQRIRFGSFVDRVYKILYVETPKVASTSILNAFNRLHGRTEIEPFSGLLRETKPEMFVHSRRNSVLLPISAIPPKEQIEIFESDEWLRFAFVRNPYSRIFSIWLNKVFACEPSAEQVFQLLDRPVPKRLTKPEDSLLFDGFVRDFVRHLDLNSRDQHYQLQTRLLHPEFFNFSFIGKLENFEKDFAKVRSHVRKLGGELPEPEQDNPSLEDWRGFYDSDLAAIVADIYAADFETFGYSTKLDGRTLAAARRRGGIKSLADRIPFYNEILKRNRLFAQLYELELGPLQRSLSFRADDDASA